MNTIEQVIAFVVYLAASGWALFMTQRAEKDAEDRQRKHEGLSDIDRTGSFSEVPMPRMGVESIDEDASICGDREQREG